MRKPAPIDAAQQDVSASSGMFAVVSHAVSTGAWPHTQDSEFYSVGL